MTKQDFTPLSYTIPNPVGMGGRTFPVTRQIINEVKQWAEQYKTDEYFNLVDAMQDLDNLLVTCWTEIDESLTRLSIAELALKAKDIEKAKHEINIAQNYLNRWQDRDGAVGNLSAQYQKLPSLGNEVEGLLFSREAIGEVYKGKFKVVINPRQIDKVTLTKVWPKLLKEIVTDAKEVMS